ncbi:hypothetical protein D3C72_2219240 [compost metagenome]
MPHHAVHPGRDDLLLALALDPDQRREVGVVVKRAEQEEGRDQQQGGTDDFQPEREIRRPVESPRIQRHHRKPGKGQSHDRVDEVLVPFCFAARPGPAVPLGE